MKKTILTASTAAALGLSVIAAPVALAQDGPVLVAEASTACGRVTLTADVLRNLLGENDRYELAVSAGAEGKLGAELGRLEAFFVGDAVSKTFTFDEDEFGGTAIVTWNTVQGPERDAFVSGAVEVDTDCTDEEPTPDPTTPPATTPQTPEPEPVDLNCVDFPLPDGRTAQDVLNETPGEDPHGLDANGNRIPCEVPDVDTEPDVEIDNNDDVTIVVPQGGVATGGGPA